MYLTPRAGAPLESPRAVTARTVRKIALCGSHTSSLEDAPWTDPSWEFWGHASSRAWYRRRMDRYFDLHPPACWTRGGKKGDVYPKWLAQNTVPIYMQDKYPQVPASIKYPKGRVLTEFSYAHRRHYFGNHAAWMIALALTEGVTHLALFGINYSSEGEYFTQRGSAEYWLGQLDGRGVNVILPEQCSLLADPKLLYGYESHDEQTGALKSEYKRRHTQPSKPVVRDVPESLRKEIEAEERDNPRPEWAAVPTARTDGGIEERA